MRRRGLLALIGALAAIVVAAVAIAAQDSATNSEPSSTATAETGSTTTPQGDAPEKNTGPIAVPDAGKLAGPPPQTARRFVSVWLNRIPSAAALRRQRPILVGLSTGTFAQLMQVTIDDALSSGDFGPENHGTVEFAKLEDSGARSASVLLVCRETPKGGSPTYTTYLAKLVVLAPGRFAMGALEPQS
jgi:hypothetical protein